VYLANSTSKSHKFTNDLLQTETSWNCGCLILVIVFADVVKGCRYCYFVYHPVGGYKVGVVPRGWTRPHEEECLDDLIGPDDIVWD